MHVSIDRVVHLPDPSLNDIVSMSVADARRRVEEGDPAVVRAIERSWVAR